MPQFERYLKYQKYVNGVPAFPHEYKRGDLIGTVEYPTLEDCEKDAIYRWVDNGKTVCVKYSLYNQEKKLKSLDGGIKWTDTNEVRTGSRVVEQYAPSCGWELQTRWTKTGQIVCKGFNSSQEYIKEESYDLGETWNPTSPAEYKYEIVERMNSNCILDSKPLIYEVNGIDPGIHITFEPYKEVSTDGGRTYVLSYKGFVQWDDGGIPNEIKVGELKDHHYDTEGSHTIRIWGFIRSFNATNNPYKILDYGDPVHLEEEVIEVGYDKITRYPLLGKLYNLYAGLNCTFIAEDPQDALDYTYYINIHTNVDFPLNLIKENCHYAYFSDCANLGDGLDLSRATRVTNISFKNCPKITKVPQFPRFKTDKIDVEGAFMGCTGLTTIDPGNYRVFNFSNTFNGCTNLVNVDGAVFVLDYAPYISYTFKNCTSLKKTPKIMINTAGVQFKEVFSNSGITEVDKSWFDFPDDASYASHYIRMFTNCKNLKEFTPILSLKKRVKQPTVSDDPELNNVPRFTLEEMFNGSGLERVSPMFRDCEFIPKCVNLFKGCDLSSIPNDFFNPNIDLAEESWKAIHGIFKDLVNLANYPILNGVPVWELPTFVYNGEITNANAFDNNPIIIDEIPVPWGGNKFPKPPVIYTVDIQNEYIFLNTNTIQVFKLNEDGSEGEKIYSLRLGSGNVDTNLNMKEGKYIIKDYKIGETSRNFTYPSIYDNDNSVYRRNLRDILDTGILYSIAIDGYVNKVSGGINLWKNATSLRYVLDGTQLTYLNPNFFLYAGNVTNIEYIALQANCSVFTPEHFSYLNKVTIADYAFENSNAKSDYGVLSNNPIESAISMFSGGTGDLVIGPMNDTITNIKDFCYAHKGTVQITNFSKNLVNMQTAFDRSTINGEIPPISGNNLDMARAFEYTKGFTKGPILENGILNMYCAFFQSSIEEIGDIPESVTDLGGTFRESLLRKVGNIYANATDLSGTFRESNLSEIGTLPSTVVHLSATFYQTHLLNPPIIPDSVETMQLTFEASSLKSIPLIGKNVNNLDSAFSWCRYAEGSTPVTSEGYKLWERAGKPGYPATIRGYNCFNNCRLLSDYWYIPEDWGGASASERALPRVVGILHFDTDFNRVYDKSYINSMYSDDPRQISSVGDGYTEYWYKGNWLFSILFYKAEEMKIISDLEEILDIANNTETFDFTYDSGYPSVDLKRITLRHGINDLLFSNKTNLNNFFNGMTNLQYVNPVIFKNCSKVTRMLNTFKDTQLTELNVTDIMSRITSLTDASMILRDMPYKTDCGICANNPNITNMKYAFQNSAIETVPQIGKNVEFMNFTFGGCTNLRGSTPVTPEGYKLWERAGKPGYPTSIVGQGCFKGCTQLDDYALIPDDWK